MPYIDIKNVTYTYPLVKEPCIKDITVSIEKGKFYAIVGANGSGKTTLCNIIRGFIPGFYQGEMKGVVELEGKSLEEYTLGELTSKIGYVFQNPFNQITGARDNVYEEIAYGLENLGVEVEIIRKKVEEVMELTNTAYLADKNPFELSGGQQQRVAFASILALEPDIFVIDEPTSQLDPKETERVFDIIDKMKKMGKTIILVEHKIELIAEYADSIIALEDGRVVKCGEKHDVLSDISLIEKGIALPQTVLLADEFRRRGIPPKEKIITKQEMIWQLKQIMGKSNAPLQA
ncbi:ABC transporter ATP-binding protein [Lachnospiraceae bacterium]|nr:ABC transporter ATP-binding protein [Lachnospiraceae bacterium]